MATQHKQFLRTFKDLINTRNFTLQNVENIILYFPEYRVSFGSYVILLIFRSNSGQIGAVGKSDSVAYRDNST